MSLFKSTTGLFSEIKCPQGKSCTLGNCMYAHAQETSRKRELTTPELTTPELPTKRHNPSGTTTTRIPSSSPVPQEDVKKLLVPKVINSPPVQHRQRVQFVNVIRDKLVENGYLDANPRAIEIESNVAERCTQFTYAMGIRSAVREITTKQLDNEEVRKQQAERSETKILCDELVNLLVPIKELERARHVLDKPDAANIESTTVLPCARCRTSFPIFNPATSTTSCRFHLMKRLYDPSIKKLSPVFPCCGETLDESSGCEVRNFHVHKHDGASEMQAVIPFRRAPPPGKENLTGEFAVGLDCEMAWTSKGFELIRVTVVGYISRKTIFDRLVWPVGKILDLNTRFSGVSDMSDGTLFEGTKLPALTLEDLYTELFKVITSNTIIIGHGLVNDMNALRLIHDRIVDTAILYPRVKQRTFSLKELSWDFLSRNIQSGEHDSMEDSLAAIDIVRQDISNRCFPKVVKSFR